MAIWQYTFHLLPKQCLKDGASPLLNDDNGVDYSPFWKLFPTTRAAFNGVSAFLKTNKSWSNSIDQYGDIDSNCVEVYFENEMVESVSFRLNYTINYEYVLTEMFDFCVRGEFVLIDEDLELVVFNLESIDAIIRQSSQLKVYKKLSRNEGDVH